jgi:hypothetical protein
MIKLKDLLHEIFPMGYMVAAANANIKQKKKSDFEKQPKEAIDVDKEMKNVIDMYNKLSKEDLKSIERGYMPLSIENKLDKLKTYGITFNYKSGTFNQ